MTLTLILLLAAIATAIAAPTLLAAGSWQLRHPRTALTSWFGMFFLGLVLVVLALVSTVLAAVSMSTVTASQEATILTFAAWLGLGGVGAVIAFVGLAAEPLTFSYREQLDDLAHVARTREHRDAFTLVRFDHDEAFAIAVPGRQPEILLSTACEELLTPRQLEAVLAHELAHLRHLHGWAVRIAEINAACVRWLPAGRTLRRSTLLLIELAADDVAARQAGPANLANALATLSEATGDQSLEVRAVRLMSKTWPTRAYRRLPAAVRIANA